MTAIDFIVSKIKKITPHAQSFPIIKSTNASMEITLFVMKLHLRACLNNAHEHKETEYKYNFSLS
jgi:hypothetical protein